VCRSYDGARVFVFVCVPVCVFMCVSVCLYVCATCVCDAITPGLDLTKVRTCACVCGVYLCVCLWCAYLYVLLTSGVVSGFGEGQHIFCLEKHTQLPKCVLYHNAAHCQTLEHTATLPATDFLARQAQSIADARFLQHTCNTLQHTCNTLQRAATH